MGYQELQHIFQNQQTLFDQAVDSATLPDSRVDVKISSSSCTIKLRYYIKKYYIKSII